MESLKTFSAEETQSWGRKFASKIPRAKSHATVLALQGDLGAGKTTFTQGFLKGLGVQRRAVSPTFIILRRYPLRAKPFKNLYHFDAYRLKKAEDLEALEFKLILGDPKNLVLVEWPDRIRKVLPKGTVWLRFSHRKKENERTIAIKKAGLMRPAGKH